MLNKKPKVRKNVDKPILKEWVEKINSSEFWQDVSMVQCTLRKLDVQQLRILKAYVASRQANFSEFAPIAIVATMLASVVTLMFTRALGDRGSTWIALVNDVLLMGVGFWTAGTVVKLIADYMLRRRNCSLVKELIELEIEIKINNPIPSIQEVAITQESEDD